MSWIVFLTTILLAVVLPLKISCEGFIPDYKLALKYSILYYEAQRSGKLPENNRIKWRGDSAVNDNGVHGEDLSGGFYDGSDFVKFGYITAYATTMLTWGFLLYPDVYKSIGEYQSMLELIKWSTDYFIKCHVFPNVLYGQVGDFKSDHKFWGRPEELNMTRPAYQINETHPGSDLASEVSAVFSSASIAFKNVNYSYSKELLNHSVQLYEFAKNFRGLSKDAIPGAKMYYHEIYSYGDHLVWAAIWLYRATDDQKYLAEAERFYHEFSLHETNSTYFFFDDKMFGIRLLLGNLTKNDEYTQSVEEFCNYSIDHAPRTDKGLVFIKKIGTLALAANTAFICLEASKLNIANKEKFGNFAKQQINYMLGSTGQSYVVGYGNNYPKRPFHSASSCPDIPAPCGWKEHSSPNPNPQIVYGALVSGPNISDYYVDRREDFYSEYNVLSMDFNAGFQNALAALIQPQNEEQSELRRSEEILRVVPLENTNNETRIN